MLLIIVVACTGQDREAPDSRSSNLRFTVPEGRSINHFLREDGVSAHLNLRTSPQPRLVIAFPAGNSGAILLFANTESETVWGPVIDLQVVESSDDSGRTLHGIIAEIDIATDGLELMEADVGSLRFLRRAVDYSALPQRNAPVRWLDGHRIRFERERPDGQSSYFLEVEALTGRLHSGDGIRFSADENGALRIRVAAASGDPLENPVPAERLVTGNAADNGLLRQSLAFLSYENKLLAGSWRFLTYFGRDTLLSLRLLMPVLTAEAVEIGLGSVFARVNDLGEVAHEEEIGELAVYRNIAERGEATAEPVYDYNMVDDNLMLAPVLLAYVETFGRNRANGFLSGDAGAGISRQSRLLRNLQLVARQAQAFADDPVPENLISIKDELNHGNWRDSQEGLAGGRYPYDVNAVLMPAALQAAAAILDQRLLDDLAEELPLPARFRWMADSWKNHAPDYFEVSVTTIDARARIAAYAEKHGYPPVEFPAKDVRFRALALDSEFRPLPIMHSDVAADLLFLQRPEQYLSEIVQVLVREFPAGLATPAGILSANPAYADPGLQTLVTRNHYHGTVIWSWQQAMIIAGIDIQLDRIDLSGQLRRDLETARSMIWRNISANRNMVSSELWSIAVEDEEFVIAPFGQATGHLTESNAVQLWSTVFLAFKE